MRRTEPRLVLTCEHGGNRVPSELRGLFTRRGALLRSHRGWDPGALAVARSLSRATGAPLVAGTLSRLVVDLNRSPHNPAVFSALTRTLAPGARAELLRRHHRPHWDRVRDEVARATTVHVAVHSFTPVRQGVRRHFGVGLLYDPKRPRERALALEWQRRLRAELPAGAVRRNAPYRGDADGLTTALRRERSGARYLGLELELSQAWLRQPRRRRALVALLRDTLPDAIAALR